MTIYVRYEEQNGCVAGAFAGRLDREAAMEYIEEVKKVVSEHECKRYLNDMRKAELALSTADIYYFPGVLDAAGIDRSWRRAIVASRQLKDYRFFVTVAHNRGYTVQLFEDPDEAREWLKESS